MHHTALIRRQRIHGSLDNIQEEHEEESEEEVDLAEVDSGDDSTNLDGESNDNLISDNTMPSAASNTRSGKEWDQRQKKNIFFTKSMYVPYIV